jgi:hypothetical protein
MTAPVTFCGLGVGQGYADSTGGTAIGPVLSMAGALTGAGGGDATSTVFGEVEALGFSGNFVFGPLATGAGRSDALGFSGNFVFGPLATGTGSMGPPGFGPQYIAIIGMGRSASDLNAVVAVCNG